MKLCCALLAVLALAALPPAAHAVEPVNVGPGVEPDVAVDPSGTAYIAWIGNEPNTTTLHFCRLPRGAAACDVSTPIATPGTSLNRPFVAVSGATVRVISYRYGLTGPDFDAVYMFTSLDGGATFDAGVQIGNNAFYDAVEGPGNAVSLIANNSAFFQRAPTDGSGKVTAQAHLADDHPYSPTLVARPIAILAVLVSGSGDAEFRVGGASNPNDANTWSAPRPFSNHVFYPRATDGSTGTFLMSQDDAGKEVVQHFGAATFDPPVTLPGPLHQLTGGSSDITEDPAGRLHAVVPFLDGSGTHIEYLSSDDGSAWKSELFQAGPDPKNVDQAPGEMRAAVAADHLGVAVWQDAASPKQVHALAVGPEALAPPAIGKSANAAVVTGKVLVKRKGSRKFVALDAGAHVPLGSTFDTTHGTLALDTAAGAGNPLQHGVFSGGQFTPRQSRKNPLVTLSLAGGGLGKCGRRLPPGGAPKKRKRSRTLFSNVKGHFRTRGRNSSASARGTKWRMTDTCGGTLTIARSGTVVVRDFTLRKNKTLHSGQRYFAKAPPLVRRRGNR